jgi:uncharacterized protein (DUF2252 family)
MCRVTALDSRALTGLPAEEARAVGRGLREQLRRSDHEHLPDVDRDPVAVMQSQHATRIEELVGVRVGRMLESPFAFLRGSAALMALDLRDTAVTGPRVVSCGDAHVANFGFYASPERRLLFDLNDFDEAWTAPWEWDVRRLAASTVVAGRDAGHPEATCRSAAERAVRGYRENLRRMAGLGVVERFHTTVDAEWLLDRAGSEGRRMLRAATGKARRRTSEQVLSRITTTEEDGRVRMREEPPLMRRVHEATDEEFVRLFEAYRRTTRADVRLLLHQMRPVDHVLKVVGVGSVGTRCFVVLLQGPAGEALFLQVKEAEPSVLATYGGQPFDLPTAADHTGSVHHGMRVVAAQRVLQSHSDPFLGWAGVTAEQAPRGRALDFFWRQLRDMKGSVETRLLSPSVFQGYAEVCGALLARAHAQSPACVAVAAYLGGSDAFDRAVRKWAVAYADRTERDHASLAEAARTGRVPCETGV